MSQVEETSFIDFNSDPELQRLYQLLQEGREDDFIRSGSIQKFARVVIRDTAQTLLHRATMEGLPNAVKKLLDVGAKQIETEIFGTPIELAGRHGYHKVFKVFLQHMPRIDVPSELLIELLKYADEQIYVEDVNHNKCLDIWFQLRDDIDVNIQLEKTKNTPLHYAVRYGKPAQVQLLLKKGASLISENIYGDLPIDDIDASTLEAHLTDCILFKNVDDSYIEQESEITVTYDYKSLVPLRRMEQKQVTVGVEDSLLPKGTEQFDSKTKVIPCVSKSPELEQKQVTVEMGRSLLPKGKDQFDSETKVISCISKSPELERLLAHPVITSFLFMKWYRVSRMYFINLGFYLLFCLSLMLNIFLIYDNDDHQKKGAVTFSIFLAVTLVILISRETFQMVVSPRTYFFNFENWLEILLIIFTVIILFQTTPFKFSKKQMSATAVLLAGFELVLLIGLHPVAAIYVAMLRTVSKTFFKYLLGYCILIFAFSFSFYILFNENTTMPEDNSNSQDKNCTETENEIQFFDNLLTTIFKTILMLTGEFDSGNIKFHSQAIVSHFIFMLFVFLVAIVLFNLLNGLAVSDTHEIKSNAEIVAYIARIEHISYLENIFSKSNSSKKYMIILQKLTEDIVKRVCLFPYYLNERQLEIFLKKQAQVLCKNLRHVNTNRHTCTDQCPPKIILDERTAKRTKQQIRTQIESSRDKLKKQEALEKQDQQHKYIEELQKDQKVILDKLDEIINKCSQLEDQVRLSK